MPKRHVPYEVREEFFDLACSGMALQVAAGSVGVSPLSALVWWRASGLMMPAIQVGRHGGLLPDTAPVRVSGEHAPGQSSRQRRLLTSEDRSVIAAGLRTELFYGRSAG